MSSVHPIKRDTDLAALGVPPAHLLVLYFHAAWAAPCKQMSEVLAALASTYPEQAPVTFAAIDAEELPDLAEDHDVTAVPFIVLKRGDAILESISGSDAAKVRTAVERHAQGNSTGNGAIPPAQSVTRPATQPEPTAPVANGNTGAPVSKPTAAASGDASGSAKNLSGYAPGAGDPATAPDMSSGASGATGAASEEELNKRLGELVKAAPVMLFMKGTPSAPQCGFSRQLVGILREQGVRYGFFNILADDEVRQGLKAFADWPTFPQLWLGGELVGGLDIVREELDNDDAFFGEYKAQKSGVAAA